MHRILLASYGKDFAGQGFENGKLFFIPLDSLYFSICHRLF